MEKALEVNNTLLKYLFFLYLCMCISLKYSDNYRIKYWESELHYKIKDDQSFHYWRKTEIQRLRHIIHIFIPFAPSQRDFNI